jgi:ABC-type glycerol-3-phosphate transport system permease component
MVMAALVLASLPTLLVFLFCQNIIMRGIVIPTMK